MCKKNSIQPSTNPTIYSFELVDVAKPRLYSELEMLKD